MINVKGVKLSGKLIGKVLPAVVAMVLFLVVSIAYFAPQLQGEVLPQHDVVQYEGMAHDIKAMRASTGEDPQWTGGMFSGMPAYMISVRYPAQVVKNTVGQVTRVLDTPAAFLFFSMAAFWLMLVMCGVGGWVAIAGALAYGLSTYFLLIIQAGHITKMWAAVYAPLMIAGAWMTLRGNMWTGAALTALFTSLEVGANHPQITYYFLLAMAALWISDGVVAWKGDKIRDFARRTALLAAAGLVAVASNFSPLWYTMQHTPDTTRGGSELAVADANGSRGLSLDYATAWSYGRAESLNMLIPDFMGRDSATTFASDGAVAALAAESGISGIERQLPLYWGDQPYTGGPTYLGAATIFLAVLGLILVKGRNRWWVVAVCGVMLLLSWGRNLMWFTSLAFDLLPGYNKFRTVSMALTVLQWAVPLMASVALWKIWRGDMSRQKLLRAVAWAAGTTGGLCFVVAVAAPLFCDFGRDESAVMMTDQFNYLFRANNMENMVAQGVDVEWGEEFASAMAEDRAAAAASDAWRSLAMILLAAATVVLFALKKIGRGVMVGALCAVMLLDLVPVGMRFLSHDDFVSPRTNRVTASAADKAIMADKDLGYRVVNKSVSTFNDATTSYFHRSVGGYHGAKLSRYQDLIDRYLADSRGAVASTPEAEAVLDMLNTRYAIIPTSGGVEPRRRTTALGAAWFVDGVVSAEDAAEEIDMLGRVNLATTAVVAECDMAKIGAVPTADTTAARSIELVEYRPNYLKYKTSNPDRALAVFSEIFYDKGWTASVDGSEAEYLRADYVLRAMLLPEGEHTVEWSFRAPGWTWAEGVTGLASAIILIGVLAVAIRELKIAQKK